MLSLAHYTNTCLVIMKITRNGAVATDFVRLLHYPFLLDAALAPCVSILTASTACVKLDSFLRFAAWLFSSLSDQLSLNNVL